MVKFKIQVLLYLINIPSLYPAVVVGSKLALNLFCAMIPTWEHNKNS